MAAGEEEVWCCGGQYWWYMVPVSLEDMSYTDF